jgi:hypothetical protein
MFAGFVPPVISNIMLRQDRFTVGDEPRIVTLLRVFGGYGPPFFKRN